MLSYETAAQIFEEIRQKALQRSDEAFRSHYSRLLEDAAEYAKTRLAWSFMTPEARRDDDSARSVKHDAFMLRLSIVGRLLGIDDLDKKLPDRKTRGDLACYMALFLSLEQR